MKFVKAYVYAREDDQTRGLYVWEEEVGWLHIAKIPLNKDTCTHGMSCKCRNPKCPKCGNEIGNENFEPRWWACKECEYEWIVEQVPNKEVTSHSPTGND